MESFKFKFQMLDAYQDFANGADNFQICIKGL